MLYYCITRLNQIQCCYLQLMLMLPYDSLNLVDSRINLWTVTGP